MPCRRQRCNFAAFELLSCSVTGRQCQLILPHLPLTHSRTHPPTHPLEDPPPSFPPRHTSQADWISNLASRGYQTETVQALLDKMQPPPPDCPRAAWLSSMASAGLDSITVAQLFIVLNPPQSHAPPGPRTPSLPSPQPDEGQANQGQEVGDAAFPAADK